MAKILWVGAVLCLAGSALGFQLVGHRGVRYLEDENTLAAMELALDRGANAIETDVRLTSDYVPVIMHDASVDRTTDGRGKVRSLTFDEFTALRTGRGHHPPTLAQVLERFGDRDLTLWLEIKETDEAMFEPLARLLERQTGRARIVVFAIDATFLGRIKARLPGLAVYLAPVNPVTAVDLAREHGLDGLLTADFFVTQGLVKRAHRAGLPVVASMIARPLDLELVMRCGVDGVLVNDPAMYLERYGPLNKEGPP